MTTTNLNQLELNEFIGEENSRQHCKATFPLFAAHGTKDTATVYFELAPGDSLGRHTDSAEEILIVLEGQLVSEIGGEEAPIQRGSLALVPKMVPHNLTNVGKTIAKVLGVFGGASNIVATFEQTWLPTRANVVDTAQLV